MKKLTFQRNELYKKAWSKPVSHLIKAMGISSHQFYKVCRELNVPTPSTGYWAKIRHGKDVMIPELPESDKDSFTLTVGEKPTTSRDPDKSEPTISVPKKLTRPHLLIKQARENINKKSLNRYNRVRGGAPLDLSVSAENVDRGLRILDALFKEIENRDYKLSTFRENNSYWMLIGDGQDEVYFQLREKGKRTNVSDDHQWPEYEYTPTGELQLALFRETYDRTGKVLSDTQSQKLEGRLDEFFVKLEQVMDQVKKRRLELEKYHRQQREKREIKEAAENQRKEETERRSQLEQMAKTYTTSHHIYDFVDEIENHQAQLDLTEEEKLKFKAWIIWARNHADRLNPVKLMIKKILE